MSCNYFCSVRQQNPNCEYCNKTGSLVIQEEGEYKCPNNDEIELKLLGHNSLSIIGIKMSKEEIKKDRSVRASNHFKNEVLPNIPNSTAEGKHFRKKYSKTGN